MSTRLRAALARLAFVLVVAHATLGAAADVRPVVVQIGDDRFEISGEGNSVTGVRRAPVPYTSVNELTAAVGRPEPVPAAARLVRAAPPQVIDYVFGVTEDGVLIVGQQIRSLDETGRYTFTEGHIKRAYSALEATVPWTWIVDIPLGREVGLMLELRALTTGWPVRAVSVLPSVLR